MRPAPSALLVWLLLAPCLRAEPGRTAGETLRRPPTARPMGLGEAFVAVDGGVDSLGYNPAGTGRLARPELGTTYTRGIASDQFGFVGYAHPLPRAVLTAAMTYYDGGEMDIKFSDGRTQTRTAQQDAVAQFGAGIPLDWGLCVGATAKVFRFTLAEEAKTTGYAADAGLLWHSPLKGLNIGASLQNLGPDVKFEEEADPLPATARFGAAYSFSLEELSYFKEGGYGFSHFLVTVDAVKVKDESSLLPSSGLELGMPMAEQGYGAVRIGYMFSRELNYFTVGVGMRQGRWLLDYALGAMRRSITNSHHISLGVKF